MSAKDLIPCLSAYISTMSPHHRDRIGGKLLIEAYEALLDRDLLLATLTDILLGDEATDRSPEALIRAARNLK